MSRTRLAGLLALALCAFAVSAASASAAAPEFKPFTICNETAGTGNYGTKAICESPTGVEKAGGKFHRHNIFFTSTSGVSTLKTAKNTYTCESETDIGDIISATSVKMTMHYFRCGTILGETTIRCKSKSPASEGQEDIKTEELTGTLGGTEAEPTEKLEPSAGSTAPFTELKCGTLEGVVKGAVTGKVSPVKTRSKTGKVTFLNATGLTFRSEALELTSQDDETFFRNVGHTESEEVEVT